MVRLNSNSQKDDIVFYPQVSRSKINKINFYYIVVLYYIFILITVKLLYLLVIGIIISVPLIFYIAYQDKLFKKNLLLWNHENVPYVLSVNKNSGDISVGGYQFKTDDIKLIKIKYYEPPQMKGITKYLILMFFINCEIIFELDGGKTVSMPLNSREQIKSIVNIINDNKYQTSFDQKIYRLCGL